jgi:hypothetical protein
MIEYVSEYTIGEKPYICKKFTASSGEEAHTAITISNTKEIEELSLETIYAHLDALVQYISDTSSTSLSVLRIDENINHHPWPIKNWENIEWAKEEVVAWWRYIYFKDLKEREDLIIQHNEDFMNSTHSDTDHSHDHSHEGVDDHTHDPETEEEIPNA